LSFLKNAPRRLRRVLSGRQFTRLLKQVDGGVDAVDAALDAGAGACEFLGYGALLQGDGFEAFAELVAGELAIGGEIGGVCCRFG
jgi:hypothetical protein